MTNNYILTHSPREICSDYTKEDIIWEINWINDEFKDMNAIFGDDSPLNHTDDIWDLDMCSELIDDWYDEDKPNPEDLVIAIHLYVALSIKLEEE